MMVERVLAIIPARGGSKGIPRKNIRELCGKPLLQYTAEAALAARRVARAVLTTDDEEIAEVGRACGLEVPFLRPAQLAGDTTPTLPVMQHTVEWLESEGDFFDAICLLQPTHPMRRAEDIDGCIERLEVSGADAVVTVLPVPPQFNPHWVLVGENDGDLHWSTGEETPIPRRQELPPAFQREGSVYVTRRDIVMEFNSLYGKRLAGYALDRAESVNIDSEEDWIRASRLLSRRRADSRAGVLAT